MHTGGYVYQGLENKVPSLLCKETIKTKDKAQNGQGKANLRGGRGAGDRARAVTALDEKQPFNTLLSSFIKLQ